LGDYSENFKIDIDKFWTNVDYDQNGLLDKKECREFMKQLARCAAPERAQNYDEANFDGLFERFDEDANGFIEKAEMAVFIKHVFRKDQETLIKSGNKKPKKQAVRSVNKHKRSKPTNLPTKAQQPIASEIQADLNKGSLSYFLKDYAKNFSNDIDVLWGKLDSYKNKFLAQAEALTFMIHLSKCMIDKVSEH